MFAVAYTFWHLVGVWCLYLCRFVFLLQRTMLSNNNYSMLLNDILFVGPAFVHDFGVQTTQSLRQQRRGA